jgi:hypothetical protein
MHCALVTLAVLAALSAAGVQAGNELSLSRGESLLIEPLCTSKVAYLGKISQNVCSRSQANNEQPHSAVLQLSSRPEPLL